MEPTQRFATRAADYSAARPGYPSEVLSFIKQLCQLGTHADIADVGSGTGIFSKLLLDQGYHVFGIEPNQAMRQTAEQNLAAYSAFTSLAGQAEQTGLADDSVNLVTVAQAYHWFDPEPTTTEFLRILKPGGTICLLWNLRDNQSDWMRDYEQLLIDFGTDYLTVAPEHTITAITHFNQRPLSKAYFANQQRLNRQQLTSRLLSCSYIPSEDHPDFQAMMDRLESIYQRHQQNGWVTFLYQTHCYYLTP